MRSHFMRYFVVAVTVSYLFVAAARAGGPSGTAFTYQGQLRDGGAPVNATCDFEVSLWSGDNDPDPGTQLGITIPLTTAIDDGLFQVELDFGAAAFNGDARWLHIEVCCASPCSPAFVTLAPRQPITAAPYAAQTRGLFVDGVGNVNIGTDAPDTGPNPATRLHLEGPGYPAAFFTFNANGGNFDAGMHLRNDGDLKWHVFNQAARDLFNIRNSVFQPVIVAAQDGNVGIGTTTPKQRLHNVGDYYGRGHMYLYAAEGDGSDGTAYVQARDDSGTSTIGLRLRTQDAGQFRDTMHLTSDGNVGIGTASPSRKLQVGDIQIPDSEGMIRLASRSGTQASHRIWDIGVPETDADSTGVGYSFVIDDIDAGKGPEFMVKFESGNVGIGTTAPAYSLHVKKTHTADWIAGIHNVGIEDSDHGLVVRADGGDPFLVQSATANLINVKQSGNVGIGTTDPLRKLQVGDASIANSEGMIRLASRSGTQGSNRVWDIGVPETDSDSTGTGYSFVIDDTQTGTDPEFMVKFGSGNVGIGTVTPQGKLDVNGAIYQRGGILHADYVFDPQYDLESVEEHSAFMWSNGHLPAVPRAKRDGQGREIVEVGSHRRGILEELEKAHIYIERLKAENDCLVEDVAEKASRLASVEERLARLEKIVARHDRAQRVEP